MALKDDTLKMLLERPTYLFYRIIEADTGLKTQWLTYFATGRLKIIDVDKVETLYNYLLSKK